ncbi:MAG: amino acid--tRNA ligase-related protein [Patescibacteria group bacterium]|nr:amino acid--tRNA ligase-related protein [Patescibacteria group bacterium]
MLDLNEYHYVISKLRSFFTSKGYVEVPVQSRLSILAACEDPETIAKFEFSDTLWPLPQTGQMWLEYELLKNPDLPGVFCISTSYRDEPNPIPGRHDKVFPMFEFEGRGDVQDLMNIEKELIRYLGFTGEIYELKYEDVAKFYSAKSLEADHESKMTIDFSSVVLLTNFPFESHPFWNMKHRSDNIFNKVDVILHGMETIGSSERSCNVEEMRDFFHRVSNGGYADKLFGIFGKERVLKELEEYFSLPMSKRFGAGIGVGRMIRALKHEGVLKGEKSVSKV